MWPQRRSKYGNIETEYRGTLYRSRAEANYAMYLDSEKQKGAIKVWEYEKKVDLIINTKKVCEVNWDFFVTFSDNHSEYHEIKGKKTETFVLKEKIFRALHPNVYLKIINSSHWS